MKIEISHAEIYDKIHTTDFWCVKKEINTLNGRHIDPGTYTYLTAKNAYDDPNVIIVCLNIFAEKKRGRCYARIPADEFEQYFQSNDYILNKGAKFHQNERKYCRIAEPLSTISRLSLFLLIPTGGIYFLCQFNGFIEISNRCKTAAIIFGTIFALSYISYLILTTQYKQKRRKSAREIYDNKTL